MANPIIKNLLNYDINGNTISQTIDWKLILITFKILIKIINSKIIKKGK